MKIITRQALANEAADRWREVMERCGYDHYYPGGHAAQPRSRQATLDAIRALGPEPDPDAVDVAIGVKGWTTPPRCDECRDDSAPFVVQVGEEPDYESNTAHLCGACIGKLARVTALGGEGS